MTRNQPTQTAAASRLFRTASWGIWITTIVMCILIGIICFFLYKALIDPDHLSRMMADQVDLAGASPLLSRGQALGMTTFWLASEIIAFVMLFKTRALFYGIRSDGIFTDLNARRIRHIGWIVLALAPVSILVDTGTIFLLRRWRDVTDVHIDISLSDGDLYALVVGLVLVALGHIMVDATRIHAENRAFI